MYVITAVLLSGAAGALIALFSVRPTMKRQLDDLVVMRSMAARQERDSNDSVKRLIDQCQYIDNLKADKAALEDTISTMRDVARVRRVESDQLMASFIKATKSSISSIRFTARVPTDGWVKTTFKLGRGSCGKDVKLLRFKEEADRYIITQVCTDDERKEFIYFKTDVDGRIEISHNGI